MSAEATGLPPPKIREHEYGIDLLRLLAMLMITILHCVNQFSGLLSSETLPMGKAIAYLLEITCFCGVDCFAMISGYLLIFSKVRVSKMLNLWLTCLFYSSGITALFLLFLPQEIKFTMGLPVKLSAPVSMGMWWYITAYFGLMCFVPFVNTAMNKMSFRENTRLVAIIFVIASLLPSIMFFSGNILSPQGGYSAIWLQVCYIFGAYIRIYKPQITSVITCPKAVVCYAVWTFLVLSGFALTYLLADTKYKFVYSVVRSTVLDYTKLPTLVSAVLLLLIFMQIKLPKNRTTDFIVKISSSALGVYLLQCHEFVWGFLVKNKKCFFAHDCNVYWKVALLIAGIYVAGISIDLFRAYLFRILKVQHHTDRLVEKVRSFVKL